MSPNLTYASDASLSRSIAAFAGQVQPHGEPFLANRTQQLGFHPGGIALRSVDLDTATVLLMTGSGTPEMPSSRFMLLLRRRARNPELGKVAIPPSFVQAASKMMNDGQ